jgi:hypothetical protein
VAVVTEFPVLPVVLPFGFMMTNPWKTGSSCRFNFTPSPGSRYIPSCQPTVISCASKSDQLKNTKRINPESFNDSFITTLSDYNLRCGRICKFEGAHWTHRRDSRNEVL